MLVTDLGERQQGGGMEGVSSHIQPLTWSDRSAPGITVLVTEKLCWVASGGPSDGKAATLQDLRGTKIQVMLTPCLMALAAVGCT